MYKEYVVTFINLTTNKVKCYCFNSRSESEAIRDFKECYRHDSYKVLSVVETGR